MPVTTRQQGFTLLELVIAMAIFAVLGLASWRVFDGVVRAERSSASHEQYMRTLLRAVAVIERDVLQVTVHPLVLEQGVLQLQRGNWRNPLDQPRSELQNVTYRLDQGTLWRESLGWNTLSRSARSCWTRCLNCVGGSTMASTAGAVTGRPLRDNRWIGHRRWS